MNLKLILYTIRGVFRKCMLRKYCYKSEKSRYCCFDFTLLNIKIMNKSYKNNTMW